VELRLARYPSAGGEPVWLVAGASDTLDPALGLRLRNAWERANNRWNQWVLNYSRGQQFDLLRELGFDAPSWQDLATLLIGFLCTAALAGAGWAWWDRHRQDPWQRLQRRVQRRLATLGVSVLPHQAPRTRAEQVRQALGDRGEAIVIVLEALDRARYADGRVSLRGWWRSFDAATRGLTSRCR